MWDANAWPLAGVGCFVYGYQHTFLIAGAPIQSLVDQGLTALTAMDQFLVSKGTDKEWMKTVKGMHTYTVEEGEVLHIPAGFIPFATSLAPDGDCKQDKAVAIVFPPFTSITEAKAVICSGCRTVIHQAIVTLVQDFGTSTVWKEIGPAAKAWATELADD